VAVRAKAETRLTTFGDTGCHAITWTGLLQSSLDTGVPFECPGASERSVQVSGTLGAGGSVRFEGSNLAAPAVDADWAPLSDPQGVALDMAAISTVKKVQEMTRWVRPRITAGDGTTSLTVTLLAKRAV
jgi:hypothetical protein